MTPQPNASPTDRLDAPPKIENAISAKRLRVCPLCDYNLKGSIESRRCPECGFAFGENLRTYPVATVPLWLIAAMILSTALLCDGSFLGRLLGIRRNQGAYTAYTIAFVAALFLLLLPTGRILITGSELALRGLCRNTLRIPWKNVTTLHARRIEWNDEENRPNTFFVPRRGMNKKQRAKLMRDIATRRSMFV